MSQKLSRVPGGPAFKLVILALMILGMGLAGCSQDLPTQAPGGSTTSTTGVFHVGTVDDDVDFEFISTKNGDPEDPIYGPFAIRGRNIRYDAENSMLIVDLSVENMGENTFDEGVTLTFMSLLPEGVTVLNADNNENGNGAAINFEFDNDDGQWTPGEESLPRETHFSVAEGTSIGFVARLDTGTGGGMGSIGGMVWNDENGDGIMDEGESGIEGAMLELSAEGMEAATVLSSADGTYSFDDLASGFYMVVKKPTEGMVPTTSPRIYVILVAEDGTVSSFLAANFGCMKDSGGGGKASIGGIVFNDLNGNRVQDEGEPGLSGIAVDLSGDATASVMSDTTGAYVFADLVMGSYEVTSTGPDGFVPTTGPVLEVKIETADQVVDDAHLGWMDESLAGSAVIKGVVWNDLNGDGMKTEDEPGIEGLAVDLAGDASATMTTLADGVFFFENLSAGSYKVTSVGPEGWKATTDSTLVVILATDDEVFNSAAFGWMEDGTGGGKASIGGIVFDDLNGNKVMDEGEPGIEGIEVALSGDATATAMSDSSGAYSFTELVIGTYVATCSAVDGFVSTTGTELDIKIETEDQVVDNAHFGWMKDGGGGGTAVIKGLVWNDLNGDGQKTEDEPGLDGLTVDLAGDATASMITDADGVFTFIELMAGTYQVTSTGPEGWKATTGTTLEVILATDDEVFNSAAFGWMEDGTGGGTASIGGIVFNDLNGNKVMDEGEPGIEGLKVALDGTASLLATTDADGAYMFAELGMGEYKVRSTGPEGWVSTTGEELTIKIDSIDQVVDNAHFGWMDETTGSLP